MLNVILAAVSPCILMSPHYTNLSYLGFIKQRPSEHNQAEPTNKQQAKRNISSGSMDRFKGDRAMKWKLNIKHLPPRPNWF